MRALQAVVLLRLPSMSGNGLCLGNSSSCPQCRLSWRCVLLVSCQPLQRTIFGWCRSTLQLLCGDKPKNRPAQRGTVLADTERFPRYAASPFAPFGWVVRWTKERKRLPEDVSYLQSASGTTAYALLGQRALAFGECRASWPGLHGAAVWLSVT